MVVNVLAEYRLIRRLRESVCHAADSEMKVLYAVATGVMGRRLSPRLLGEIQVRTGLTRLTAKACEGFVLGSG